MADIQKVLDDLWAEAGDPLQHVDALLISAAILKAFHTRTAAKDALGLLNGILKEIRDQETG